MLQELEKAGEPEDPPGGQEKLRTIRDARREAASVYWSWKKGTRDINPHQVGALVTALGNIAGMIEKERQDELEKARAELAEIKQEIKEIKAAHATARAQQCPDQSTQQSLN